MAYVADFTTKSTITNATTIAWAATDFPDHVAGDYLIVAVTSEAEATTTHSASAGWTQIGTLAGSSTTQYSSMWYKKCASSAETCTITLSVTKVCHSHAFLIVDADPTTFLDGTPAVGSAVAAAAAFNSTSITTTQADSLLLFYIGVDQSTTTITACHSDPGSIHFIDSSDNSPTTPSVTAGGKNLAAAACGWCL